MHCSVKKEYFLLKTFAFIYIFVSLTIVPRAPFSMTFYQNKNRFQKSLFTINSRQDNQE
jgi:hypothetical protein